MKKFTAYFIILSLLLCLISGCSDTQPQILASTLPVYEFTHNLCAGTGLQVGQLVTENISCLHDYTLQVSQMRMVESAEVIVISGAGLEDFLSDVLHSENQIIDSSVGCHLHEGGHHSHEHTLEHGHLREEDPHIWLSPANAKLMAANICAGLIDMYPQYADVFTKNLADLTAKLEAVQRYGEDVLAELSCRELVTFHDGFGYFAESFDLTILEAIEEESGSEASAKELKHLITLVQAHQLPAVFTEENSSTSAAEVLCAETGISFYALRMGISGEGYFETMYHNIDTIKEALG